MSFSISGCTGRRWVGSSQKLRAATTTESGFGVSRMRTPPGARARQASWTRRPSVRRRQVLDDVERDHATQALLADARAFEEVALLGRAPFFAQARTMSALLSTPRAAMPWSREHRERFAPAAPEIEHLGTMRQIGPVDRRRSAMSLS